MARGNRLIVVLIRIVIGATIVVGLAIIVASFLISYESFKPRIDALSQDGTADRFTAAAFDSIIAHVRLAGGMLLLIGGLLVSFRRTIEVEVARHIAACSASWRKLWTDAADAMGREFWVHPYTLVLLVLVAILVRLQFLFQPIRYDEAYTFLTYASHPFWYGISRYGDPNNHVLNTACIHAAYLVFGSAPWVIRMPAFIAGILVVPATYAAIRLLYGRHAALVAVGLVATSSALVEYSTNGRGYTIVCLFFMVALAAGAYLTSRRSAAGWTIFVIASALGFYAVPIMLYPFGVVALWFALSVLSGDTNIARRVALRDLALAVVGVAVLTLFLYAPVLVVSGAKALVANPYVETRTWWAFLGGLPPALAETWRQWNRDIPLAVRVLLVAGLLVSLIFHRTVARNRTPVVLAVLLWTMPVLFAQRVVPYARVWVFLVPLYAGMAAAGLTILLRPLDARSTRWADLTSCVFATALTCWLWLGVMGNRSILASPDTGTLPDAERITLYLKGRLEPGDCVLSDVPSNYPLRYYFTRHDLRTSVLADPTASIPPHDRLLVVVNEPTQTLDYVMRDVPAAERDEHGEPALILRLPSASVHELRRRE